MFSVKTYQAMNLKSVQWLPMKPHHRRVCHWRVSTWNTVVASADYAAFWTITRIFSFSVKCKVFYVNSQGTSHLHLWNNSMLSLPEVCLCKWAGCGMFHIQWFLWYGLLTMARWVRLTSLWTLWSDLNHCLCSI
jgi:hypothetical protein